MLIFVTIPYIKSSDLIYLIAVNLYPSTNFSLFIQILSPENHFYTVCNMSLTLLFFFFELPPVNDTMYAVFVF